MAEKRASLLIQLKDKVSKSLGTIGGRLDKLANRLNKSKFLFAGVAAAAGLLAKTFISAADKMEGWTIAFDVMLGSADAAKKMMEDIAIFARETPFDIPGIIDSSKQLLAFGIEADKIIPTMKSLGDIAAGVGTDKLPTLVRAFGKIRAKGKATMEELNMLLEAGVPVLDSLAEGFGVSTEELFKMVSTGKVGFEDVNAALLRLSTGTGKFADLMKKKMETVEAVFSNVRGEVFELSAEMGKYLLPIAKSIGSALIKLLSGIRELSPKTKLLILAVGGLAAGFAALVAALGGVVAIAPFIAAAFGVIFSPITLVVGAVAGLAAMFTLIATNALGFRDILTNIFKGLAEVITLLAEAMVAAMTLKFATAKEKTKEAWDRMKELTAESWNEMKTNVGEAIDSIIAKIQGGADAELDIDAQKRKELARRAAIDKKKKEAEEKKKKKEEKERLKREQKLREEKEKLIEDSLGRIASMSTAQNKVLAAIGKAAAIRGAIIDTHRAAAKALTATIPPWNFALMAGVIAQGMLQVAKIRATRLAEGGIVLPRAGGVPTILGEAGRPEAVIPLESPEAGEMLREEVHIHIHAGTIIADDMSIKEFAEKIDEKLFELRHNKETVAF